MPCLGLAQGVSCARAWHGAGAAQGEFGVSLSPQGWVGRWCGAGQLGRAGPEGSGARACSPSQERPAWPLGGCCWHCAHRSHLSLSGDLLFCKRLEHGSASSEEMSWGPGRHRLAGLPACVTLAVSHWHLSPGQGGMLESLLHRAEVQGTPQNTPNTPPLPSRHTQGISECCARAGAWFKLNFSSLLHCGWSLHCVSSQPRKDLASCGQVPFVQRIAVCILNEKNLPFIWTGSVKTS